MEMRGFIADLERRASLIRETGRESASEFCGYCRKPLASNRKEHRWICGIDHCNVCADLFNTVLQSRYFLDAQMEFEMWRCGLDRLRPGNDYFRG